MLTFQTCQLNLFILANWPKTGKLIISQWNNYSKLILLSRWIMKYKLLQDKQGLSELQVLCSWNNEEFWWVYNQQKSLLGGAKYVCWFIQCRWLNHNYWSYQYKSNLLSTGGPHCHPVYCKYHDCMIIQQSTYHRRLFTGYSLIFHCIPRKNPMIFPLCPYLTDIFEGAPHFIYTTIYHWNSRRIGLVSQ